MKKIFALFITCLCVAKIDASDPGWYLTGFGGWNQAESPSHDKLCLELDNGYVVGATLGYKFIDYFRLEAELAYRENSYENFIYEDLAFPITGSHSTASVMGNVLIDFSFYFPRFHPFVGAGIGWGSEKDEIWFSDKLRYALGYSGVENVNNNLIYQGIGGLSLEIGKKADLRVAFHYFDGIDFLKNYAVSLSLKQYF